jgi:hypothetical protein
MSQPSDTAARLSFMDTSRHSWNSYHTRSKPKQKQSETKLPQIALVTGDLKKLVAPF